mgnify:FL=1|tara:strand:+ start:49 stop:636 length:588 start_codon:yes stop_codon:yes gene_type:complete
MDNIDLAVKVVDKVPDNGKEISTYRYNLHPDIIGLIEDFVNKHKYDDRESYKEGWLKWCKTNNEIVENEIRRLNSINYNGDVVDKMYKAGRYYYRKKKVTDANNNDNDKQKRRKYISINNKIIVAMDTQIKNLYLKENYKPSDGYETFCSDNVDMLTKEIKRLFKKYDFITKEFLVFKFKKTYKNRYYRISRGKS